MKICVVGAGSIGGLLGVKLALACKVVDNAAGDVAGNTAASEAANEVTLIARGPNLAAIRANGMKLVTHDGQELVAKNIQATDKITDVAALSGKQDLIILGMKAHQVEPVVDELASMMHADTVIVPMQNGIPWWYFQRHGGLYEGRSVASVDPSGKTAAAIDPKRLIGCVVYPAAEIAAPGVIHHIEGDRFPVGELDASCGGLDSERVRRVAQAFTEAGFKSPILPSVRSEIWLKLWGNLTFNPISALTHSTLVDICQYPLTRDLARNMMKEAQDVAAKLGIAFRVDIERRIGGAEKVGKHKTSMLQDVEAGRDPEIDALVGAVIELGNTVGVPTPHISAVYSMVKLLGRTMKEEKLYIKGHPIP